MESTSILESVKKLLGISEQDDGFDQEIKDLINAEFLTLNQIGVGPKAGFSIKGPDDRWDDYTEDTFLLNSVREFVYLRVRRIFDPPASSTVADALQDRINELEFRINVQAEGGASDS